MAEIPEHLLMRSAEARAKALGVPVEQVLAEMRGEAPPAPTAPEPVTETPPEPVPETPSASAAAGTEAEPAEPDPQPVSDPEPVAAVEPTPPAVPDAPSTQPGGTATLVRPVAPARSGPDGKRTQRLLTVVRARAIQQVKDEPTDKVTVWPHLLIMEFVALLAITAFLIVLSVILQAPLLAPANSNATPNPSKAPWYFLGLQELLAYFDPAVGGVAVPLIVGLVGIMAFPYLDRNPSTRPSDRKFAILMFTFFVVASATLTMIGVLFRGPGQNFTYPWKDGIWFDDLKDWVNFE